MNLTKQFDVICMGRVAVDFYSQQIGARLEDSTRFARYLGGSSGNVAFGTARQGLRSSMLARVGDEHMGRFVREELNRVGCDTSHLITDKTRLTALVLLGIKNRDAFPLIFYRDNCADMAITAQDVSEEYIASARSLAITGTHLSHQQTREAVLTALTYARRNGVRTALDIDYRPVLWGLTSPGDGETRFIAAKEVTAELQSVLHLFDVIVGTEEEFHIAGGSTDTLAALKAVRSVSDATLVCKRGASGCSVFTDAIPATLDDGLTVTGVRVEVLNVLGAGDAFMSGLLRGYLNDEGWEQACRYANACGALVVSRHACSSAMPTREELDDYLSREDNVPRPDLDEGLNHLHRVTTRQKSWPELCILAFDHRSQLVEMARKAGTDPLRIPRLKQLIWEGCQQAAVLEGLEGKAGILCDGTYGQDVLNDATGQGWWIARPVELPGSRPLRLEHGDIGVQLSRWPQEQIVKCLVFCHPQDDQQMWQDQDRTVLDIWQACQFTGNELLLEILLPASMSKSDAWYPQLIEHFYKLGVKPDWWKLPPLSAEAWQRVGELVAEYDPHCRGALILGLDMPTAQLKAGFDIASQQSVVKGFAVGRTLFGKPATDWLGGIIDDAKLVNEIVQNYRSLIALWRSRGQ